MKVDIKLFRGSMTIKDIKAGDTFMVSSDCLDEDMYCFIGSANDIYMKTFIRYDDDTKKKSTITVVNINTGELFEVNTDLPVTPISGKFIGSRVVKEEK